MRRPTRLPMLSVIAFALAGVGLVLAVLAATGVLAGPARTSLPPGPAPVDPSPVAAKLQPFDDCTALRDWYVGHAIGDVTAYGWKGQPLYALEDIPGMRAPQAASPVDGRSASATGTNTQEADVDEPDVAKTDGTLVVRVLGRLLVVTDVSGDSPHEVARYELPSDLPGAELLLVGRHAVVVGSVYRPVPDPTRRPEVPYRLAPPLTSTRVVDVDLSAPGAPKVVADQTYPGSLVSARQYGDVVRLVTDIGRPALPFAQPDRGLRRAEALGRNRALVQQSTIDDWLPAVEDNLAGTSAAAVDCASVYHPRSFAGGDTILVSGLRPGSTDRASTAVTASGQLVYSSVDRLYVAAGDWVQTGWVGGPIRFGGTTRTDIHAFALDGVGATYVGSGSVPGAVRDRWSMDEHDGYLRVAVDRADRRGTDHGVVVLAERGGGLAQVGQVWGLGRDEELQAVRWFDDLAVLVTFRQTDPLFTVDLSDPTAPRARAALEIPGYSSYLHPIGGDLLLGIGTDATPQGQGLGAQAAVFDIRDLAAPKRVARVGLGRWSQAEASWEPREFTWLPAAGAALTAVQVYPPLGPGRTEVHLLRVGPDGSLTDTVIGRVHGGRFRALPLADGRVALVDAGVRVVDVR